MQCTERQPYRDRESAQRLRIFLAAAQVTTAALLFLTFDGATVALELTYLYA